MGLSLNHFVEAKRRISRYLEPSPMVKSDALQKLLDYDGTIYLKLDCEQPTGSFKVRGAFNVLQQLNPETEHVVAFSSGNFALALAYASSKLNKKATVVMPQNAPRKKIEGTLKLGAEIVFCGERHEDGEILVKELAENKGYTRLHPFNNYQTIAGQGTAAIEVLQSNPHVRHFFCPVGGGGLLSGCAWVIKNHDSHIQVRAVEPIGADDFCHSFKARQHMTFEKTNTIADGLRSTSVGTLNYPILMSTVDHALAVSEEHIIEAMRLLWEHHDLVIEPSGAVALAGFLASCQQLSGEVVILITGKNVDLHHFNQWIGVHHD
jgi:threonine dehydratase